MSDDRYVKSGGGGMFMAQKVDVDGAEVVCDVADLADGFEDVGSGTAPITSSSPGPLKFNTTLLCSPSTSLPMMMSEHKSLMTSATTFTCISTALIVVQKTYSVH